MNHHTRIAALAVAFAALLTVSATAHAQVAQANVRIRAEIESIDRDNRMLTLRGPAGGVTENRVPDDMVGFEALQVGDRVTVTFLQNLGLRLRTAGAPMPDLTELSAPGGGPSVMRTMAAAVTLIDPTVPAVSIRSPEGDEATFRVPSGMSLDDIQVGDSIDVTYVIPELVSVTNQ